MKGRQILMRKVSQAVLIAFMANVLGGCGGGSSTPQPSTGNVGNTSQQPAATGVQLSAVTYPAGSSTAATSNFTNGNGDTIYYWTKIDTTTGKKQITETLVVMKSGAKYRTLYDNSGAPTRIVDEASGNYMVFSWETDKVLCISYDKNNAYQGGYAVIKGTTSYSVAKLLGSASVNGQITAQSTVGSQVGSLALTPTVKNYVLGTPVALSSKLQSALAKAEVRPVEAAALEQYTLMPVQKDQVFDGITNAVSEMWQNASVPGWAASNRRGLLTAATLAGAAIATGVAVVPGVAVASFSVAMLAASYTSYEGGLRIVNELRTDAGMQPIQDDAPGGADWLRSKLANAWLAGNDLVQAVGDAATQVYSTGAGIATYVSNLTTTAANNTTAATAPYLSPTSVPTPATPPAATTPVQGMYLTNSGTTYSLTGTVSTSGQVSASGSNGSNGVSVTGTVNSSTVSGTVALTTNGTTTGTGTLSGQTHTLGACQTNASSGGQGSFSYAYYMGTTGGTVSITYDMYTIPDRLDVYTINNGSKVTLFSTGGLVSGGDTVSFSVVPDATVFVGVSAPTSGTAWDFSLGCPQ